VSGFEEGGGGGETCFAGDSVCVAVGGDPGWANEGNADRTSTGTIKSNRYLFLPARIRGLKVTKNLSILIPLGAIG